LVKIFLRLFFGGLKLEILEKKIYPKNISWKFGELLKLKIRNLWTNFSFLFCEVKILQIFAFKKNTKSHIVANIYNNSMFKLICFFIDSNGKC
jgi:hypothetical protein